MSKFLRLVYEPELCIVVGELSRNGNRQNPGAQLAHDL